MEEVYKKLAERNGWRFAMQDDRPYFMKDGNYATPDETTSEEDKELLATIISEGSDEMKQLILTCWDNAIRISGPCSGIKEFHKKNPICLHFGMIGQNKILSLLYQRISAVYPGFNVYYREEDNRLDINYSLKGKELTVIESNTLFEIIRKELESILMDQKGSSSHR